MENYTPRTLDGVLKDFKARREGILKALTTDVEAFCEECDPEKENLCLYGNSDGTWKVTIPAEEIPPELPEPALGINFARDGMPRKDWLSLVAVHSDSWLYAVAFYYGSRFDRVARERLFNMMNELPTIFDIVTGRNSIRESSAANNSSAKSKSSGKVKSESQTKSSRPPPPKDEDEDSLDEEEEDEEHGDTLCGNCGGNYAANEFWIGCDVCEKWFHGKCVKMTPARAEHIKNYKCPSCNNKRARP